MLDERGRCGADRLPGVEGKAGRFIGVELRINLARLPAAKDELHDQGERQGHGEQDRVEDQELRAGQVERIGQRCQRRHSAGEQDGRTDAAPVGLGNGPVSLQIDAAIRGGVLESLVGRRPDVGRRLALEQTPIAGQRALVPVDVLFEFVAPAARGLMVQRPAEQGAETTPVRASVRQVQVPGLIDFVGRRNGMPRFDRQEGEAAILVEHPPGEGLRPAVFSREPGGKRQRRPRLIEREVHDPPIQFRVPLVHRRSHKVE